MRRSYATGRLYVGLMFATLVALGTCAVYVLARGQFIAPLQQLSVGLIALAVLLTVGLPALLVAQRRSAARSAAEGFRAFERASTTDNLTRIGNKRAFEDDFAREISRARRNKSPLVLALVDVDGFKEINRRNGHEFGDDILMLLANRLSLLRQEDRGYRVGSDEFALLLANTGPEAARSTLTRLRKEARKSLLGATVSIGYANLAGEQLDVDSYELAVSALCEAKKRSPNGMVCYEHIGAVAAAVTFARPRLRPKNVAVT